MRGSLEAIVLGVLSIGALGLGACGPSASAEVRAPRKVDRAPPPAALPENFGTAHPYTLLGVDEGRRWVALCQARADTDGDGIVSVGFAHHGHVLGDEMRPYFVLDGGEGEPIQRFLGSDPSGDWVALARGGKIDLLNTRTREARELSKIGLDEAPDPSTLSVRALRFSPAGGQLLLLKASDEDAATVALLFLEDGTVRDVSLGAGRVWKAGFSPDGKWLHATVVRRDTNGNGKLDLPEIRTTLDADPCGQPASYSMLGLEKGHDALEDVLVPLEGGPARESKGLQGFLDGDLVRSLEDGTLVREDAKGERRVLAPASCGGNLDYYSLEHQRWLVACYAPTDPPPDADGHRGWPSHIWLFGAGQPDAGKDLGIQVEYGIQAGSFGTERYSYLRTEKGLFLFDLEKVRALPIPVGMSVCGADEDGIVLRAPSPDTPVVEGQEIRPRSYIWTGDSKPQMIGYGHCQPLTDDHVLVGRRVYSVPEARVVGDATELCRDDDCFALTTAEHLDTGFFLLDTPKASAADLPGLERTLRESLIERPSVIEADYGPVAWKTWDPPKEDGSLVPEAVPERPDGVLEALSAPISCDVLSAPLTTADAGPPAWTVPAPFSATFGRFPQGASTSAQLPPPHQLAEKACEPDGWAMLLEGLERAARQYVPEGEDSNWGERPAFVPVGELGAACAPVRRCDMGHEVLKSALVTSGDLDPKLRDEARSMAYRLILSCETARAKSVMLGDDVPPEMQVEWLVAGQGKPLRTAARLEGALRRTYEEGGRYSGADAVAKVAQETRPDIVAMLLRLRAKLTPEMLVSPLDDPDESRDIEPSYEFDMSLSAAKSPRLRSLYVERCKAMPMVDTGLGEGPADFRCRGYESPGRPPTFTYVGEQSMGEPGVKLELLPETLTPEQRTACDELFDGTCPEARVMTMPHGDLWGGFYSALVTLSAESGEDSPLAGLVVDTPLRRRDEKITATLVAWGEGKRYESGASALSRASLGWEGAADADGHLLARRGFVGWLNAVAAARGDERRFFWLRSFNPRIVMGRPEVMCKLADAKVIEPTVHPMGESPR